MDISSNLFTLEIQNLVQLRSVSLYTLNKVPIKDVFRNTVGSVWYTQKQETSQTIQTLVKP